MFIFKLSVFDYSNNNFEKCLDVKKSVIILIDRTFLFSFIFIKIVNYVNYK